MSYKRLRVFRIHLPTLCFLAAAGAPLRLVAAQNPEMQQKVWEVKQAMADNKQWLAQ